MAEVIGEQRRGGANRLPPNLRQAMQLTERGERDIRITDVVIIRKEIRIDSGATQETGRQTVREAVIGTREARHALGTAGLTLTFAAGETSKMVNIAVVDDAIRGDAETGTGIEAGAGLRYEGSGVSIEGSVHTLVAHEESGYEEWGASGTIRTAGDRSVVFHLEASAGRNPNS